jgi:archaetidylinositol phosphate synthase
MLEACTRKLYQRFLVDPLVRRIGDKLSPITVTLFSAVLGVLFIPALVLGRPMIALMLLLASGYCDTLDGSLARHQNTCSPFGSMLDIMSDRLVEFSVIFAFYLLSPIANGLACMLMLGSVLLCITSFLVTGIFSANDSHKSFHYSAGIMERAEAFAFFIVMIVMPNAFSVLGYVFSVLVLLTALWRLWELYNAQV